MIKNTVLAFTLLICMIYSPASAHIFEYSHTASTNQISTKALSQYLKPSNITIDQLTTTALQINWKPEGPENKWIVKYGLPGFNPEIEGKFKTVIETPQTTITTLKSGEPQEFYIKAISATETLESEFAGPFVYNAPCEAATIPFFEGFEDGYIHDDNLGNCWTQELITNTYWKVNNTITANNRAPRTGDWDIYVAYGSENWMYYPVEVQEGISYTLTFYARQSNTSGADIAASYGISDNATDMVNEIIPTTQITQGDYQEVSGAFVPEASGVIYVGIHAHLISSFFPFYMTMDDISITESQTCLNPTNLQVEVATPTTGDISWTAAGSETNWLVKYGEPGFDPAIEGSALPVVDNPTTTIPDLIPAHIYNVFVRAECGGLDGNSYFTGPITLKTTPLNDDVCNATALVVNGICANSNFTNVGATLERDEPQGSCYDAAGEQTVWFTFEAPLSGNVTITTDFEGGTLEDTELAVYAAPTDCQDLTTLGAEIGCDEDGGDVGSGFLSVVSLTELTPATTYYIQINGFMSFDDGTMEGSFCIEVRDDGVDCQAPTNLAVNDISSTSAEISWTPMGSETQWEIKYGSVGFDPTISGISIIDTDGDPTHTLSDLEPNASYDVYVRAMCILDTQSEFTHSVTFNTMQLSVGSENFKNFTYYPNPAKDEVNIIANFPIENVQLFNVLGQIIKNVDLNKSEFQLNTGNLKQGVYFIKVTIDSEEKVFRIVKE